MRYLRLAIALLVVLTLAAPLLAAVGDEDLERAREVVDGAQSRANEIAVELNEAWSRQAELEDQISILGESIGRAKADLVGSDERLAELAVELYMGKTSGENIELLFNTDSQTIEAGNEYLETVSGTEEAEINQLLTTRAQLEAETELLAGAEAEQTEVAEELETLSAQVQEELSAAQASYDQLYQQFLIEEEARRRAEEERRRREEAELRAREEEERQATSTTQPAEAPPGDGGDEAPPDDGGDEAPPDDGGEEPPDDGGEEPPDDGGEEPPGGGSACPVAGPVSFTDTWGAPRSGGRTHQGVDMLAAYGTPLAAAFDGTIIQMSSSSLGGITLWLRSDAGDEYYYAHMDSYGAISEGAQVSAGTIVGYNGSSGNAPEGTPHLHWEYHPGGGGAVNPTPLASQLCG